MIPITPRGGGGRVGYAPPSGCAGNEESNGTCYSISGRHSGSPPSELIEAHPARPTTLSSARTEVGMYQAERSAEKGTLAMRLM